MLTNKIILLVGVRVDLIPVSVLVEDVASVLDQLTGKLNWLWIRINCHVVSLPRDRVDSDSVYDLVGCIVWSGSLARNSQSPIPLRYSAVSCAAR